MNNEMIKRIKANNKCLLVSSYNDDVSVGICNYKYCDNSILIECINYTNLLESLNNNNNCVIYITVCDESYVYYIIIKGVASLSSTSFRCPSICNQNNRYLIDIEITNIDCYQEKRSRI